MKLTEELSLVGTLSVSKVFNNGVKETVFTEENLITLIAKQKVLNSIYATSLVADPINVLKVGTGGTVDPGGLYPKTVLPSVTDLYTALISVATSYVENLTVPSVTFIADLDQGSGNGSLITEAGLFKTSGSIFNIKTFPGIPKTSEFSLHFEWTIKIA
jgi:hypothetical protein